AGRLRERDKLGQLGRKRALRILQIHGDDEGTLWSCGGGIKPAVFVHGAWDYTESGMVARARRPNGHA
ncbi:MAG: hypothetical protein QOD51_1429, partial [Candidatus Eremiobacteraeota bacterium]|nr:hypothetical protein [Candidatus Eremiobacteraeota bacterium]